MAQTFSGRPLIILELLIEGNTPSPSGNTTSISWKLQARETASQPSWALDLNQTSSVNFFVSGGGTITSSSANGSAYTFGTTILWNYDFRPSGLQTRVIATGSFVVTHNSAGTGGTVSALALANDRDGLLGGADHSILPFVLTDYDRGPTWSDIQVPTTAISGNSYSGYFRANNASSYSRSGNFPPGLNFNTQNGDISGVPNQIGSYGFTVTANGTFEGSISASRTITVNRPTPSYTDSTISSPATWGVPYVDGVTALNATSYSRSGNFPPGLSLNTSNGAITGIPTALGSFTFQITGSNETGSVSTGNRTINVISPVRVNTVTGPTGSFVTGAVNVNTVAGATSNFVPGVVRVWNGSFWAPARLT
jgi:hypothetical protein